MSDAAWKKYSDFPPKLAAPVAFWNYIFSSILITKRIPFNIVWQPRPLLHILIFISVRIVLLPSPGILTHLTDTILCLPAKLVLCLGRITVAGCNIARSSRLDYIRNLHTCCSLKILHDVKHAVAVSGTQIVDAESRFSSIFLSAFTCPMARSTTWM